MTYRSYLLFFAALVPFFSALLYFVWLSDNPIAQPIYTATKIFTLVWPLAFYRFVIRESIPSFPLRGNIRSAIVWGLISGFSILALVFGLLATPIGDVVNAATPQIRLKAASLGVLENYILFALFLSLLHSLIEEYFWRWFIFGELRKLFGDRFLSHALAAIAFALHHIVVTTQFFPLEYGLVFGLAVGIGGAAWSYLYRRQRSLLGAWISHAIVDLGILGFGYTLLFPG